MSQLPIVSDYSIKQETLASDSQKDATALVPDSSQQLLSGKTPSASHNGSYQKIAAAPSANSPSVSHNSSKALGSPTVGKSHRKLTVHPPVGGNTHVSSQTLIAPKPASSTSPQSVSMAPRIISSNQQQQQQPAAATFSVSLSRKRSSSNPASVKGLQSASSFHGKSMQSQSGQLSNSSFSASQHMSTYKKHKSSNTVTPQQSFANHMPTGIYTATYSDIPVFEMMVNNVAVMRRKNDSSLNATQILKVAGVDKSKRTKILEREILTGKHEKVQGGYGKYQGTWIPYDRGVDLCRQYSVYDLLQPLLELDLESAEIANTPTKEQAMAARRKSASLYQARLGLQSQNSFGYASQSGSPYKTPLSRSASEAFTGVQAERSDTVTSVSNHDNGPNSEPPMSRHTFSYPATTPVRGMYMSDNSSKQYQRAISDDSHVNKRTRIDYGVTTPSRNVRSRPPGSGNTVDQPEFDEMVSMRSQEGGGYDTDDEDAPFVFDQSLIPESSTPLPPLDKNNTPFFDHSKEVVSQIFVELNTPLYSILGYPPPPYCNPNNTASNSQNFSLDVSIDNKGHTALHWAACLGRISLVRDLIRYGANRLRASYEGESALVRAVLVTNNYDVKSFSKLLDLLYPNLFLVDKKGRSVLHHIASSAGITERETPSRYYMECLVKWVKEQTKVFEFGTEKPRQSTPEDGKSSAESKAVDKSNFKSKFSYDSFVANVVNLKDKNGDTALNIAARIGDKFIVDLLLGFNADPYLANRAGLRPIDFGIKLDGPIDFAITDVGNTTSGPGDEQAGSASFAAEDDDASDAGKMTGLALVDTSKYPKSVIQALSKTRAAQRKTLDTMRVMLGELQTTVLEDLAAKQEELQKARVRLQDMNIEFAKTDGRYTRLASALDNLRTMKRHAQNYEYAVLKEDKKFRDEGEDQDQPSSSQAATEEGLSGFENEAVVANGDKNQLSHSSIDRDFDADEPFRIDSIASLVASVTNDVRSESKSQDNTSSVDYTEVKQRVRKQLIERLNSGSLKFITSQDPLAAKPSLKSSSAVNASTDANATTTPAPSTTEVVPLKSLLIARLKAYNDTLNAVDLYKKSILENYTNLEPLFCQVVSICTCVPESDVDELLTQFVKAVESDPEEVDLKRVAGFLKKVS